MRVGHLQIDFSGRPKQVASVVTGTSEMSAWQLFFSPYGRISRLDWWAAVVSFLPALALLSSLRESSDQSVYWFVVAGFVVLVWSMHCVTCKRMHDLDYDYWPWFFALAIAPMMIQLAFQYEYNAAFVHFVAYTVHVVTWIAITYNCACRQGSPDPNEHGESRYELVADELDLGPGDMV